MYTLFTRINRLCAAARKIGAFETKTEAQHALYIALEKALEENKHTYTFTIMRDGLKIFELDTRNIALRGGKPWQK